MSVTVSGNYVFVQPGEKAFKVASNFTNYIELGAKGITHYYLEGKVESDEFVINASLLDARGKASCHIVNNFPQPPGCTKDMTRNGYRILSESGDLILAIEVNDKICLLRGTIYDSVGGIVAKYQDEDFLVFQGPAVLGKSGAARGIVLN